VISAGASALAALVDPVVLMYHRVCADDAWRPSDFLVTASVFREQMRYLAENDYYTPRLSDVLGWGRHPPHTPRRPVVLTFDDGYADTFDNALPILEEFGFTAAVFPVLGSAGSFSWWESDPALRAALLRPADMRAMEAAGLEFGSHTVTHPRLTLTSDSELTDELTRSREVLASIVSRPLPVLAYPYGDLNERVKRAVRDAGYSAALAVSSGPLELHADPFEIRRQCISNSSSEPYMKLKLCGALKLYAWSKWKVRAGLASLRSWPERALGTRY
jgi:peptidoglycan/xylan/chitin deacetylase (PgdA/CDA1 family)